jgi:hypothetical protein
VTASRGDPSDFTMVPRMHYVSTMLNKSDELKDRIEVRRHELLAAYNLAKADTRKEAAAARDKMKAKLDELEGHLKGGWEKVNDAVRTKLDKWLESSKS